MQTSPSVCDNRRSTDSPFFDFAVSRVTCKSPSHQFLRGISIENCPPVGRKLSLQLRLRAHCQKVASGEVDPSETVASTVCAKRTQSEAAVQPQALVDGSSPKTYSVNLMTSNSTMVRCPAPKFMTGLQIMRCPQVGKSRESLCVNIECAAHTHAVNMDQ